MDSPPTRSGLQDRLADLQVRSGKSYRRLSVLAGLSPTHLSLIESGDRPTPSAAVLYAIASACGTTVEYLLTGRGNSPTDDELQSAIAAVEERANTPPADTTVDRSDDFDQRVAEG